MPEQRTALRQAHEPHTRPHTDTTAKRARFKQALCTQPRRQRRLLGRVSTDRRPAALNGGGATYSPTVGWLAPWPVSRLDPAEPHNGNRPCQPNTSETSADGQHGSAAITKPRPPERPCTACERRTHHGDASACLSIKVQRSYHRLRRTTLVGAVPPHRSEIACCSTDNGAGPDTAPCKNTVRCRPGNNEPYLDHMMPAMFYNRYFLIAANFDLCNKPTNSLYGSS
jgi:hypothetical protein